MARAPVLRRLAQRILGAPPVSARDVRWSAIASLVDAPQHFSERLFDVTMRAVQAARSADLSDIASRGSAQQQNWMLQWPGEHYRLLAGLVEAVQPKLVVEVGTYTGMGTLALSKGLGSGARCVTYDIIPWREIPQTLLTEDDFPHNLEQRIGDLANDEFFESQQSILRTADFIFLDGPKDGLFEEQLIRHLDQSIRDTNAIVVLDDIRFLNMLQLWRDIEWPKLDLTSFGHWSGTGIAELSER